MKHLYSSLVAVVLVALSFLIDSVTPMPKSVSSREKLDPILVAGNGTGTSIGR